MKLKKTKETKDRLEIAKTISLIILVLLSLVQSILLWNQLNKGMSISAFSRFSGYWLTVSKYDNEYVKNELLIPGWICISKNVDNEYIHAAVDRNNRDYGKIHELILKQMENAFTKLSEDSIIRVSVKLNSEYSELVRESLISCGYNTNINNGVISALLKKVPSPEWSRNLLGITQMALISGSMNNNIEMLICDNNNCIIISIDDSASKEIMKVYESTAKHSFEDKKNITRNMQFVNQDTLDIKIPVPVEKFYGYFYDTEFNIPEDIRFTPSVAEDRDRLAGLLFGNDKSAFESEVSPKGAVLFRNDSYLMSVQVDGYLEYTYMRPYSEPAGGGMDQAFTRALELIYASRLRDIAWNGSLYISGIEEDEEKCTFRFSFDYRLKDESGTPVFISKENNTVALQIEAAPSRVVTCKWFLLKYEPTGQRKYMECNFDLGHIRKISSETIKLNPILDTMKNPDIDFAGYAYMIYRNGIEVPEALLRVSPSDTGYPTGFGYLNKEVVTP